MSATRDAGVRSGDRRGALPPVIGLEANRWRTVDIVVVAVIAVAFGVVFWLWDNYAWSWAEPFGFQWASLITGVWLLPAVVCPLIVRKPGAALFGEVVAALVAAVLGNAWGMDSLLSGVLQGAGAELVFAFLLYRSWGPVAAMLAGLGAGAGEAIHDTSISYAAYDVPFRAGIAAAEILSAIVIAGIGAWLLVRALRRTGALEAFPATE